MWTKSNDGDGVIRYKSDKGWNLNYYPAYFDELAVWHESHWQLVSDEGTSGGALGPYGYGSTIAEAKAEWREVVKNTIDSLTAKLMQV